MSSLGVVVIIADVGFVGDVAVDIVLEVFCESALVVLALGDIVH
ncbi:hypothetical protein BTHERMOSOX_1883 [Bathymodiolus thermophilus thioautotrophic gill symbiont]|nr:hypothetical protein BTHERMOSOX_1883 [Bathymodiolus thermophilus thioautotrophic gill symbiont]